MTKRKTKLLKKFKKLPKKIQRKLETLLFEKQTEINDDRWTLVLDSVYSMMRKFLKQYNKVRDREVALEKVASALGKQHGFSLKQLFEIKVEMIKERYDVYLKKRGMNRRV